MASILMPCVKNRLKIGSYYKKSYNKTTNQFEIYLIK